MERGKSEGRQGQKRDFRAQKSAEEEEEESLRFKALKMDFYSKLYVIVFLEIEKNIALDYPLEYFR